MKQTEQNAQNNADKEFLRTEPLGRLLLKLALPTVAAQLINMLYNIVDRIYIGHIPEIGAAALTGVGVCMPLIMIVSAFAALVGYGGAPRASIFMGKQDKESAERTLGNCFTLQIIISIVLTAVLLIWNKDLLMAFGASENTIGYGVNYMNIYAIGTIFVEITLGMNAFITAQGFAKTGMLSVLIGAVANIILDPIFIYGLHMGVRGAALATIISQGLSCIWILRFLTGKKTRLRLKKSDMHLEKRIVIPCLGLGLGPFVMQATDALLNIAFNSSLQHYGGDIAVGCMTISSTIQQMVWIPVQGIGQGAQPIISYNYGAGNAKRIRQTFKCMLAVSITALTVFWLFVQLSPTTFIRIFSNSEEIIATAGWTLRVYMAVFCMFSIQMSVQQTFTALGKAKASLFIACLRKIILLIPLIFILPHFFDNKVFAVFLAEPVSDTISITASIITFRIVFKKAMQSISKSA